VNGVRPKEYKLHSMEVRLPLELQYIDQMLANKKIQSCQNYTEVAFNTIHEYYGIIKKVCQFLNWHNKKDACYSVF
jgi:hypothetical protein